MYLILILRSVHYPLSTRPFRTDKLADRRPGRSILRKIYFLHKENRIRYSNFKWSGREVIEVGRCYGMEINVEKTKVTKISRQTSPVTIMITQTQLESVECFKYLGSMLTNDGRCTCETKCRIAMAKAAFNKMKNLFTGTLDLELRKKLVKCYIWSIVLYGAETWMLHVVDQK